MNNNQISDDDRQLIERHVLLPYAIYFLDKDLSSAENWLEKSLIPGIKRMAEQEQFRVKNELRKRRIKVKSEKGWYRADLPDGNFIEKKMSADMVKSKVEELLIGFIKEGD